jgi:hypothetical protein
MDLGFLNTYAIPVIVGICLCVGYVIKNAIPSERINPYIPLIMAILGVALNIWINAGISPVILLEGMFSGLASTGLYEAFRNLIERDK